MQQKTAIVHKQHCAVFSGNSTHCVTEILEQLQHLQLQQLIPHYRQRHLILLGLQHHEPAVFL